MKKRKVNKVPVNIENDFSTGVRGKYLERLAKGSNVVALDPDVAAIYPDSEAVNKALRKLAGLPALPKRASRRSKN
jgi:hypothetical protein